MLQSYQFQTTLIQATSDKPCMHSTIIFNYMQRLNPNHYENDRIVSKFSPQQKIMKSRVLKARQVGGCTLSSEKSESFAIAILTTGQVVHDMAITIVCASTFTNSVRFTLELSSQIDADNCI